MVGITDIFIIIVAAEICSSFFNSAKEILLQSKRFKDKPIGSFTQLGKILVYAITIILIISIVINKSPLFLLSGLGAMAAILLLVFKDSILGFVASIQLSGNDMVRVGDWVTVSNYGADGDVIEINLTTIKVQNFDKTITTIPTYAFISDAFTNWRGMEDSAGRRIKRALNIKIESIKFCSPEMLEQFKKYHLITNYIEEQQKVISDYNTKHNANKSELINGRHLTNVGLFRIYVEEYLKYNPNINSEMTCMVRQLRPTEYGLPIEIYAFSKNKAWTKYEAIMADIFDHLFAATSNFELEIFERPSGRDFKSK
ncbi:MAG: mechanosensitive ion channel family protein [Lutibacter sp.]|nr:mechanosensitive ion channel family protein [Lutibacter sp.]